MFSTGSHAHIKRSLDSIGTCIAIFERNIEHNFELISANDLFTDISGKEIRFITTNTLDEIFPRYIEQALRDALTNCIEKQTSFESELIIDRNGITRWWRCIYSPIYSEDGIVKRVILTSVDITEKKLLEKKLELNRRRFEAVIEAAYDGVITIDTQQNIQLINQAAKDMFSIFDENLVGKSIETLIPQRYRTHHSQYIDSFGDSPVMSRPMHERATVRGLRRDGLEFPAEITIAKIRVGNNTEMTAVVRDISERSKLMEQLKLAAITDPLTNIYNRRHAERILTRELVRAKRFARKVTVVLFDLDHFKNINDTYGHENGDKVLLAIVEATNKVIRDIDVFSRWGGEEFQIILPETDIDGAIKIVKRLQSEFSAINFDWFSNADKISASFGLAESSSSEANCSDIISRADKAMYSAKNNGRNNYQY